MNDIVSKEKIIKNLDSSFTMKQEGIVSFLSTELDKYDWFYDISADNTRSLTVYCNYINKDVMDIVPDYLFGCQIRLAFTGYLLAEEKYGIQTTKSLTKTLLEWQTDIDYE